MYGSVVAMTGFGSSPYAKFLESFDIKPGFGGLPDLEDCFGALQDEMAFVRDRVSSSCTFSQIYGDLSCLVTSLDIYFSFVP